MKHKLPMFAIMVVTSQLALAEAANDPHFEAGSTAIDSGAPDVTVNLDQDWGDAVPHPELSDLSSNIEQELQEKLDNNLQFDMPPRNPSDPEFAGTH